MGLKAARSRRAARGLQRHTPRNTARSGPLPEARLLSPRGLPLHSQNQLRQPAQSGGQPTIMPRTSKGSSFLTGITGKFKVSVLNKWHVTKPYRSGSCSYVKSERVSSFDFLTG